MKINPRIRYVARNISFRLNCLTFIVFIICMATCYASLIDKRKTLPKLPWYAMFFKVKQTSWVYATPFEK
jgi:hypothetical protein